MSNNIVTTSDNQTIITAEYISRSNLIPEIYRNKPENCYLALDMANRLGYSVQMVMQNLYVIDGRPAWSAQFILAAMNASGKFEPIRFEFSGEKENYGCVAYTKDIQGNKLVSTKVTMRMAQLEGWLSKAGSKWKTMPDQMLRYRAASFLAKIYAPEILMGLQTVEEIEDFSQSNPVDITPPQKSFVDAIKSAKENEEVEEVKEVEKELPIETEVAMVEESEETPNTEPTIKNEGE